MSGITTHILDTSIGRPAVGVPVTLEIAHEDSWREIARGETDDDGRQKELTKDDPLTAAVYRLTFDTSAYFARRKVEAFYPRVQIEFTVTAPSEHHHVPILLNPFGFTTYRGS